LVASLCVVYIEFYFILHAIRRADDAYLVGQIYVL